MIIDFVVGLGLEVVKDRVVDYGRQQLVKKQIRTFIENQAAYNEFCSMEEEIDFEGLSKYVNNELVEDVRIRLFGSKRERGIARETIINKSIAYAHAKTRLSKQRVTFLVSSAIDILSEFYRSRINKELLFLGAQIEDSITTDIANQHKEQTEEIARAIKTGDDHVVKTISEVINAQSVLSIDQNIKHIQNGDIEAVEANLSSFSLAINSMHTLPSEYGFKIENTGKDLYLRSVPLHSEAILKHPPHFKCIAFAKIENQNVVSFSSNTMEYANRHQYPIMISIQDAKKYLGDIQDPAQHEAKQLIGKEIVIPPKPFPDAFPCSISLDGNVLFDYVLFGFQLRTNEILDDGTIIVTNKEQTSFSSKITMKLFPIEQKIEYSIRLENASNVDLLNYSQFIKRAMCGGKLTVKALSTGEDIIVANIDPFEFSCSFNSIEEDIAFFENIVSIEKHYGAEINTPHEIFEDDIKAIQYISTLVNGLPYCGTWVSMEFQSELTEDLKRKLLSMNSSLGRLTYIGSIDLPIFGENYHVQIARSFSNVAFKDFCRLKEKVEVLDYGDIIKLDFIADDETGTGSFEDTLYRGKPI